MELEEAVERPVQQLVPGRVAQAGALGHQVSNGQGEVDGGDGKAQVDMAARCVMELRVGAGENLPHDGGACALRAKRGRLLQGGADLEADGAEVVDDKVHITTIHMPLVRTEMIAPTGIYANFPALTPDEAAQKITDAMIDKPKRVSTRLGIATQVVYAVAPKAADQIAHSIYKLFPEKDPNKKEAEKADSNCAACLRAGSRPGAEENVKT